MRTLKPVVLSLLAIALLIVSLYHLKNVLFPLPPSSNTLPSLATEQTPNKTVNKPAARVKITLKGSLAGATFKQLSMDEFMALNTSPASTIGTWLGLVTQLDTEQPQVHIIDATFYSDTKKLGFASSYGTHEAYARYQGIVQNTQDFIKSVLTQGVQKKLMPFTLHMPLKQQLSVNQQPVYWVFQNRRYRFQDSSDAFAKVLIKSQQAIKQQLFPNKDASFKPTFLSYNKVGTRRPNLQTQQGKKDIQALKKAGFNVITAQQLETAAGIVQQETYIMNTGTSHEKSGQSVAYGLLRHITQLDANSTGKNSINSLTSSDIALFDHLPERVPPVAGIIVLEKQTPLSHVNILAKNRGTMNISLNSRQPKLATTNPRFIAKTIKGFRTTLYNQPVRLRINGKQISLAAASIQQVNTFHRQQRQARGTVTIETPVIVDPNRWLLNPAQEGLRVNQVGAKAANYGLIQNWLNDTQIVMPGRAIGFNLYQQTINTNGPQGRPSDLIQTLLDEKGNLTPDDINQQLAAIQRSIHVMPVALMPKNAQGKTISDELQHLLKTTYQNVGRIRFRSSTNCEDLPTFNGAGLYESKGLTLMEVDADGNRIINEKKLWKKLKHVLASLWLPRAFHEREYFGIDHSKAAMAIQINPAFSDKWLNGLELYEWANGVVLYDEKQGKKTFQVNSQWGEASVTNPLAGELPESLTVINDALTVVQGRATLQGKTHAIFIELAKDAVKPTEQALLNKLQQAVKVIFEHKILQHPDPLYRNPEKYGIDIEFKILFDRKGKQKLLFIKQARPLNLLGNR